MATFLNVTENKLLESIKKCFASLFTARAIYYMAQKKTDYKKAAMAVVVQRMIGSKKAGVAFSINPVNNNEKEAVIEAATGLGEKVVSGQVTPDNYTVDKESGKITAKISGKTEVLNNSEIMQISKALKKIESHYGFPQDVEWAIDEKDKLYILQARPVTTSKPKNKPVWKKILSREYGVQYTELSIKCLSPLNRQIVPAAFYEQIYVPEAGNETCYIEETKWNTFVAALKTKYVEHPENYGEFEKLFMKAGSEYAEISEAIAKKELKKLSNRELKKAYADYLKKNLIYGPYIWMQFIINNFYSEMVKEILTNKLGKDNKELYAYIEIALKPSKKASAVKLNEIAAKWDSLSESEQQKTYEDFKWVPCLDVHNKAWTKDKFYSHISEFSKTKKEPSITHEKMLKEVKPSEKEKQAIEIAKNLSYLKDLKDDFRRQGIFHAQKLFEEIAKRAGLEFEELSYVTEEEIIDFLHNDRPISKEKVAERKKGFAIFFDNGKKIRCESGADVGAALNELGLSILEEFSEEIKGTPASAGKAKGFVAIVKGVSDLGKIKKGDILVAVTTHPDYVPVMQRAAAIVTDEGGITSHAAIVARELGLPCVVGTRHATKTLKDGDRVEVDATAGIVRKIKK